MDENGREVLSFISGEVANYPLPDRLWSTVILDEAFSLLRRLHDAVTLDDFDGAVWKTPAHEPQEVICHNDFAPYNIVFDEGHIVGVIDFDTASPGSRLWDFAYLAYRLIPFGEDAGANAPTESQRMDRLQSAIESYGRDFATSEVLTTMAVRLEDLAAYSEGRGRDLGKSDLVEHAAMYRRDATRALQLDMRYRSRGTPT